MVADEKTPREAGVELVMMVVAGVGPDKGPAAGDGTRRAGADVGNRTTVTGAGEGNRTFSWRGDHELCSRLEQLGSRGAAISGSAGGVAT